MTDATSFSLRSIEYAPMPLTYPAQHHRNPLSGPGFEELGIAGEPAPFCGTLARDEDQVARTDES